MKIYFEDGELRSCTQLPFKVNLRVQANRGVTQNIEILDWYAEHIPDATVYTNSIFAFNNKYAWNKKFNVPEVYIRSGEYMVFTRIDKLTNKELREGHNLANMYVAGAFDNGVA